MTIKLLTTEEIKSDQDVIRRNVTSLDAQVHANAVQCMLHAEKHGDTSLMRRLLIEVVDAKTGYRRAGLINWMRRWSPMELSGDTINLSGLDAAGVKRLFNVEEANAKPFWTDSRNAERVAKPVYQDTLLNGVDRSVKAIIEAIENTVDGKAVDPSKPYFDGLNAPKVVDFAKKVRDMAAELPQDPTSAVRKATQIRDTAQATIDAAATGEPARKVAAA